MATVVDVNVAPSSRLDFYDLQVRSEGADYLIGRVERSSYLSMGEAAREALELLRTGSTISEAKALLARRHETEMVVLEGFVQTLFAAGFVRSVSGEPVESEAGRSLPPRQGDPLLSRGRVSWLFGWPAAIAGAGLTGLGATLMMLNPASRPRLADLRITESYPLAALLLLVLTAALTWKHELAHLAAARWAGVDARISLGHRFFFPVLQTDMTQLWSVPRSRRYVAYLAGIISDLVVAALAAVALNADIFGLPTPGGPARSLLASVVLIEVAVVAWQLNVFLQTDLYYLGSDVLGCRDLHRQGRMRVAAWTRRILGGWAARLVDPNPGSQTPLLPKGRERVFVVGFAILLIVGYGIYALLGAVYVALLAAFLVGGSGSTLLLAGVPASGAPVERITAALLLVLTVSLLVASIGRARRATGRSIVYRVTGLEGQ